MSNKPDISLNKISVIDILWFTVLLIVFLFGGTIQVIGIISNTVTTLIMASAIIFYMITEMLLFLRLYEQKIIIITFFIILVQTISYKINNSSDISFLVVVIFSFIFWSITTLCYRSLDNSRLKLTFKFFIFICLIQLPVIVFQRLFSDIIIRLSSQSLNYIDIGFGTFFLKSDHSLGFFVLCFIIYGIYNVNAKKVLPHRNLFLLLCFLTLLATNSKISLVLGILCLGFYFLTFLVGKSKKKLYFIGIFLIFLISFSAQKINLTDVSSLYDLTSGSIESEKPVSRYAPIILFALEPLSYFGNGSLAYYNPISKEWGIDAGFSLWYSCYYDSGIIGTLLIISLFFYICYRNRLITPEWYIYFVVISIYGVVTNTLTDFAMLLTLCIFLKSGTLKDNIFK